MKKPKLHIEPAPMAGFTDHAFRLVLRKCGAKVTWTEMISATALFHGNRKTYNMLKRSGKTIVQLFGKNPTHFESVIKSGILDKFKEININMGCPARKITSNGEGAALMQKPQLAREIIQACVRASKKPISVKIRLDGGISFAQMCEAAGAARLIVHGRTAEQGYSGKADWNTITQIVRSVSIPVIANGDIMDTASAQECINQTGAAGVMMGRALLGAPWKISNKKVDIKKIIDFHLSHTDNSLEMRKHLLAYAANFPNSKNIKKQLCVCTSANQARKILNLCQLSASAEKSCLKSCPQ